VSRRAARVDQVALGWRDRGGRDERKAGTEHVVETLTIG
jgi:hypothetical protein